MVSYLLKRPPVFTDNVYYLHEWINRTEGHHHHLFMHARKAFKHQSRELHEELEAKRLNYCVTCHHNLGKDDDC